MFCATSALDISWQHFNQSNLLIRAAYRFHMYFHIQLLLHDLCLSLPHEDGSNKVKNAYIMNAYCSICDDFRVNLDEKWMHGNWFCTTDYDIFGHEVKTAERSPPDNLT